METKESVIYALIDNDINTFCHEYEENGDTSRIRELLYEGFAGYRNQDLETLVQEMFERGMIEGNKND